MFFHWFISCVFLYPTSTYWLDDKLKNTGRAHSTDNCCFVGGNNHVERTSTQEDLILRLVEAYQVFSIRSLARQFNLAILCVGYEVKKGLYHYLMVQGLLPITKPLL
ncbi:hypothetical protein CDAR_25921 [Caerostris darwini]|uniref:LAGLIDADG homing endonuclease n=1 Tax=Caerostris darwini TaxID=1538125 RepID=A0AAV4PG48_9ARAC|nr:hypothetical protein CDAR_25921 [Caerostris darwini]